MSNFKANMTKLDTSITKVLKDQQYPNYFHIIRVVLKMKQEIKFKIKIKSFVYQHKENFYLIVKMK